MKIYRVLAAVLAAAVIISAMALVGAGASTAGRKRGDADGDGEVTVLDATRIQRVLAGLHEDVNGDAGRYGNVDGDSELSILDATAIQRWLAGYGNPYGIGENVLPVTPTEENQLPILEGN